MSAQKLQYGISNGDPIELEEHLIAGFGPDDPENIKSSVRKISGTPKEKGCRSTV